MSDDYSSSDYSDSETTETSSSEISEPGSSVTEADVYEPDVTEAEGFETDVTETEASGYGGVSEVSEDGDDVSESSEEGDDVSESSEEGDDGGRGSSDSSRDAAVTKADVDNAVQKVDEILNSDKSPEEKITELEQLRTELQAQLAEQEQEQEPGSAEQSERTLPVSLERADIERWLTEINPNFDPFDTTSPYDNNCGSCAVAVALTLSGHGSFEATENNVGTVKEMNELTGMEQAPMTPEEIRDHMLSLGPGAHAIVGVDRRDQPGHWFNVLCIDKDTVVALDGQSGEILDWPPDYGDVTNWDVSVKKEDS